MAIILCGLVLLLMKKILEMYTIKHEKASGIDLAFAGLDLFCNQNGCEEFNNFNFKILLITFRIVALLILPAYGAVVTSYLAVQIPKIPFRNLDEFITENKGYVLALYRSRFVKYYFEVSNIFFITQGA